MRALCDQEKRILETVPREGYRLAVPTTAARPGTVQGSRRAGHDLPETTRRLSGVAPVIEVLPFEDLGIAGFHAPSLRAALAESIITDLARYPEMTVLSRGGGFGLSRLDSLFARRRADLLITGTICTDGSHARVCLRLVRARTLACTWTEEVDFDLSEFMLLVRFIGSYVASFVGAKVIEMAETRLDRADLSAMLIENAARSRMLQHRSEDAYHRNIREQEVALERYPDSPWGYFGQSLALRTGVEAGWNGDSLDEACERAEELAARGIVLAPDNYLSHFALSKTLTGRGELHGAIAALERAARLNPSSSLVLEGMVSPLLGVGETGKALEVITRADRIDPFGTGELAYHKARTFWHIGAPDRALSALSKAPRLNAQRLRLASVAQGDLGNNEAARTALKQFMAKRPNWTVQLESRVQKAQGMPPAHLQAWLSRLAEAGLPAR